MKDGIGENVFQPVIGEIEFVVTQQGIFLNPVMRRRAGVMFEAPESKLPLSGYCVRRRQ
jgi:hypothetical protein